MLALDRSTFPEITDSSGVDTGRIRLIYIMGAGRSGSTVLDTILGNHPDVLSVGELVNLHRSGWVTGELCACGNSASDCSLWGKVKADWLARVGGSIQEYIALQNQFELFGALPWSRYWLSTLFRGPTYRRYLEWTTQLYQSIAEVSGKRIIVDSSKGPLRAAHLRRIPEFDVRLIQLVRDGRAVAWSRKKAFESDARTGVQNPLNPRPVSYSVAYWMLVNLLCGSIRRGAGNRGLLVRYEDLVSSPQSTFEKIGRTIGLDFTEIIRRVTRGEPLRIGHTVAGNRLRMAGSVVLRGDMEWIERLPIEDQNRCWQIAGWMLKSYGYRRSA